MWKTFITASILLTSSGIAWSQCQNSVKVEKAAYSSQFKENGGAIEVAVSAKGSFTCTLNIEKGSGPEKVASRTGSGTSTVVFDKLDINQLYQVNVEFSNEQSKFCRTLQKSQIILESK